MLHFLTGDATNPIGNDVKIIVHVVNDLGVWGAGFVVAVSKRWTAPKSMYLKAYQTNELILGNYQLVQVESDLYVLNLVAQHGLRSKANPVPLKYDALRIALEKASIIAQNLNASIHMPRIGCGLAGGIWIEVEKIIHNTLIFNNVEVYVYDLA